MYKGYIYRHWLINDKEQEKSYIGQVYNRIPECRWNDGKGYLGKHKGREVDHKMARAIKKYGWDSFSHEILLTIECETKEELWFWLDEWEKWYVEKYDSFYNGYNCTLGGSGTRGYKMNEKDRQKISDGRKGIKFTEEHKQHLSEAKKGKPLSEEHKRKLSKKVICLETLQVFNNTIKAQEWLGKGNISHNLRGNSKSAGKHPITRIKLHWMYYEDWLKLQEEQQNSDNLDTNNKIA